MGARMITETIRRFIETIPVAIVASTDDAGYPHLAAATGLRSLSGTSLLFENWLCETTLQIGRASCRETV